MPSTASPSLAIEIQAAGENLNSWGDTRLNVALRMLEAGTHGLTSHQITTGNTTTLTYTNFTQTDGTDFAHLLNDTSTGSGEFQVGARERSYFVINQSGFTQTISCSGGGDEVELQDNEAALIYCDATNVYRDEVRQLDDITVTNGAAFSGSVTFSALPSLTAGATPTSTLQLVPKSYVDSVSLTSSGVPTPTLTGNALRDLRVNADADGLEFKPPFQRVTSSQTLAKGARVYADISTDVTLTLPASPAAGDYVEIWTGRDVGANTLTIGRNGETIGGLSEDMDINQFGKIYSLFYINGGWEVGE